MGFQSQRAGAGALHLTLALAALAAFTFAGGPAAAQDWPNKPVTLIVPFAAGGGTDAFARPLTAQLDKQLNQRFLIDNRAGAGGTVGAAAAAKAEPNGYNFFVGAAHHAIAPSIYLKLDYDLEKDFVPVVLIAAPPQVVTVNPSKVRPRLFPSSSPMRRPIRARWITPPRAAAPRIISPENCSISWPAPP